MKSRSLWFIPLVLILLLAWSLAHARSKKTLPKPVGQAEQMLYSTTTDNPELKRPIRKPASIRWYGVCRTPNGAISYSDEAGRYSECMDSTHPSGAGSVPEAQRRSGALLGIGIQ